MKKELGRVGAGDREASQTRDLCAAENALRRAALAQGRLKTQRAARPGPSARKIRVPQDDKTERWVKGCKERGEWAELCFMAKAAGLGMGVSKPLGESRRYDVLVEAGGRIARVQVKSTLYRRRRNEYSLNVMGPGRKAYKEGTVDFFAVYLIPEDEWYIIPYRALGKKQTLHFRPDGGQQKYKRFREAWHLLGGESREAAEIQACAGRPEQGVLSDVGAFSPA